MARAQALPIPLAPPVTSASFSFKSMNGTLNPTDPKAEGSKKRHSKGRIHSGRLSCIPDAHHHSREEGGSVGGTWVPPASLLTGPLVRAGARVEHGGGLGIGDCVEDGLAALGHGGPGR